MGKRPKKHVKFQKPEPILDEPVQDEQPSKVLQAPSTDFQSPVLAHLENRPTEIVRGGLNLLLILIGLISGIIQILSGPYDKVQIVLVVIILFFGIFIWRYGRDLRVLLTRESLRQLVENLRTKVSRWGLEKFIRRPNPVYFSTAVVLLLSGTAVYYLWTESNTIGRFESSFSSPGVSLLVESYKLIPYNTPRYLLVGFRSSGVYFMPDEIELQTLSPNMMLLDKNKATTDRVTNEWWGGCVAYNSCEVKTWFPVRITELNPFTQLQIKVRFHLRDPSEYMDEYSKTYGYLPPDYSEYSEILTVPAHAFPLSLEYGNFVSSLLLVYGILALLYSFLPSPKKHGMAKVT